MSSLEKDLAIANAWKSKAKLLENRRREELNRRTLRNEDLAEGKYFHPDVEKVVKKYPVLRKLLGIPTRVIGNVLNTAVEDVVLDRTSGKWSSLTKKDARAMLKAASEVIRNVEPFRAGTEGKGRTNIGQGFPIVGRERKLRDFDIAGEAQIITRRRKKQQKDKLAKEKAASEKVRNVNPYKNKGGLTKKGNVDYRKAGMFYGGMVKKKK